MSYSIVDSYHEKALEIAKDNCSRDKLIDSLADYVLNLGHGIKGVAIALNLADRMIASGEIPSSIEDAKRAKDNLNYKLDVPPRKRR